MAKDKKPKKPADSTKQVTIERGIFWWRGAVHIRYFDAQGSKRIEKMATESMPAARALRAKRQSEAREIQQGLREPESARKKRSMTLAQLIDKYMPECLSEARAGQRQQELYASKWRGFLGSEPIREIVAGDIERWRALRERDGVTPATINREVSFVSKVFRKAVRDRLLDWNPCDSLRKRKLEENNTRRRFLSPVEFGRLKATVPPHRWPMVEFAIWTGIRLRDMLTLRVGDVDLELAQVTVEESKNGRSHIVPLSEEACAIAAALVELAEAQDSRWLFPGRYPDTHYSTRGAQNLLEKACEVAEITNFRWHDLRRTTGSWLTQSGVSLKTVQEVLGQRSYESVKRYAYLAEHHKRRAVEGLSAFMNAGENVVDLDAHRGKNESKPSGESATETAT